LKLSEVIKKLNSIQKELGDVPVMMSSDSEGNNFGSIDQESFATFDEDSKYVIIYPYHEGEVDDILKLEA
jgi:hypothetical protein